MPLCAPQPRKLPPRPSPVRRPKDRRVLDPGVHGVGIGGRGFEMPDPLEFPRVLGAVVPLVRAHLALVRKSVALPARHLPGSRLLLPPRRLPGPTAVVRPLDDLPEPSARLGGVDPVGIHRRPLQMVHLPAGEQRAPHLPGLPLSIRRQDERPLLRPHQDSNPAHRCLLSFGHGFASRPPRLPPPPTGNAGGPTRNLRGRHRR
jgi:hypothetical protein